MVDDPCAAVGIEWVELGGEKDRLTDPVTWVRTRFLFVTPIAHPGPHPIAVALADGEPIVIG